MGSSKWARRILDKICVPRLASSYNSMGLNLPDKNRIMIYGIYKMTIYSYLQVYIELVFDDIFRNFHLAWLLHQIYHLLLLVQVVEYNVQQVEHHHDHHLIEIIRFIDLACMYSLTLIEDIIRCLNQWLYFFNLFSNK